MKLPLPDTGLAARIEDLEIIATGDVDKIDARIETLEQLKIQTQDPSEKAALESRIAVLKAAKTKANTDKNTAEAAKEAKTVTDEAKERFKDQDIIARGDDTEISNRIAALKVKQNALDKNSPEYKALDARIKALENAQKANKKDKNSKKSDDDLAYWSGRVANASTNAFSASVNGLSLGLTGFSFSLGIYTFTLFGFGTVGQGMHFKQCGMGTWTLGMKSAVKAISSNALVNEINNMAQEIATRASEIQNVANELAVALLKAEN